MLNVVGSEDNIGAQLTLVGEQIPFGAYQAIYHKLTKKVEKEHKVYEGAYDIGFGDIENLHRRFEQSLQQYQVKASRCEVTHAIKNESVRYHSSFEKFKLRGVTSSGCTQRLSYEFDFLIVLPAEIEEASEIAQRYKIELILDQDLLESSNFPFLYSVRPDIKNINLIVEYSDYAVYQHIRSVVDEWVSLLPKREPRMALKRVIKAEHHIQPLLYITTFSAALWGGYRVAELIQGVDTNDLVQLVLLSLIFAFAGSTAINYFLNILFRSLCRFHPVTYLKFTTGDEKRITDLVEGLNKRRYLLSFAIFTCALTMCINIFSNYLYEYVFK